MSQNNKDKINKALSLISAKISQFKTTLRNGMASVTDSQIEMQHVIGVNNTRMNSLKETMRQEINALRWFIHLQKMESASLRQELVLHRLSNTNTNNLNSNSIITRELPRREKCPVYISAIDGKKYRRSIGMAPANEDEISVYLENLKPGICAVIYAAKKHLRKDLEILPLVN
ncbi:hypothetical protein G6F56_011257 [Rhizopus delemar]|nr:hypothetical protein G6F56_011257 [Rhizopus delemar]